ncbi:hypothetical protein [Actinoplanes teichomyceticus]|uniref:PT repeat-containing protein n=1 Tax=Actinoplanes teichomyceticus TaxID=1867 RepID=A0A561WM04_ACTTI|nr:hypothetical protein [Actinoplanes teichomyceticus]TWG24898.1 hypothetical protein FHX34_1021461 [Actinoplanes teichomyceticus]GIF15566.1 hypothetical protein Ate01nite_55980 [Actinoplanes teichomyceticus]
MPVVKSKMARRVAACAAVAFVSAAFTAACGGKDGDGSSANGSAGQNGGSSAFGAYTACLAENGVTVTMPSGGARPSGAPGGAGARPSGQPRPSGSFGGRGGFPGGGGLQKPADVDDATWTKAQQACASVRPSFGGPGDGGGGDGANAAYLNCLKDNGVADPGKLDASDATAKAVETCRVLQPSAAAGS